MITDRTYEDVLRLTYLNSKSMDEWTDEERIEYTELSELLKSVNGILTSDDGELYTNGSPMKGAYNYTDMNRVESAVEFLSYVLNNLREELVEYYARIFVALEREWIPDTTVGDLEVKTDWEHGEEPTVEELDRYIANVHKLNSLRLDDSRVPYSMQNLGHDGANEIEKFLLAIENRISQIKAENENRADAIRSAFIYSGEVFGGEV